MRKTAILAAAALTLLALLGAACGGGDSEKTAAPTATAAGTPSGHGTPGAPASKAELEKAFETARTQLKEVVEKAEAGDLAGTKEAYEPADDPLHMIEDALASVDSSLADSIEKKQHEEIEDPLDSANPDLDAIAKAAEEVLSLLDQAADKLGVSAGGGAAPSTAEVKSALDAAKPALNETIAKAKAGDRDAADAAFEEADKPVETIIDALKPVDAKLADEIETAELDLEDALDAKPPKLDVVAEKAQDILDLLSQAAAKLGVSS